MNGRERLRALSDRIHRDDETFLRRANTRRWRAWWRFRLEVTRQRLFLQRDHHWLLFMVLGSFAIIMWALGSPWYSQLFGFAVAYAVLWFLDRADAKVAAANRRAAAWEEDYRTLQDSIPILATVIVEEQMLDLGWRRKPVLIMGDTWTDPETGDVIDQRDPIAMWEKI